MTDHNNPLLDNLQPSFDNNSNETQPSVQNGVYFSEENELPLFSVSNFTRQLKDQSHNTTKKNHNNSENINSYDIAVECARVPYFRIKNYPIPDYSALWLPLSMRGVIGNAVHDFLQSVPNVFSETEVCIKIPRKNISVRLDALINDNILVEIKSCNYKDLAKILNTSSPRAPDFYQAIWYKYLLENYIEEIKQQPPTRGGSLPKYDKYNIRYIQNIYLCHELISSDSTTIAEDIKFSTELKRKLDSKKNPFWFITCLTLDLTKIDIKKYEDRNLEKYTVIKEAIDTNTLPPMDNKFVDTNKCFFCIYKRVCEQHR